MESYSKRMNAIIEVIRQRKDWVGNHSSMDFGDATIGYYDTESKSEYFSLKHNDAKVTHLNDERLTIEYPSFNEYDRFNLDGWLGEIEVIVKQRTIVIDGKKYLLREVKA